MSLQNFFTVFQSLRDREINWDQLLEFDIMKDPMVSKLDTFELASFTSYESLLNSTQVHRPWALGPSWFLFRPHAVHFELSMLLMIRFSLDRKKKLLIVLNQGQLESVGENMKGLSNLAFHMATEQEFEFFIKHPGLPGVVDLNPQMREDQFPEPYSEKVGAFLFNKVWSVYYGGKSASVILASADLERAAQAVVAGAIYKNGGSPWSLSRVLVQESVESEFKKMIIARACQVSLEPSLFNSPDYLQMVNELTEQGEARRVNTETDKISLPLFENVPHCTVWQQRATAFPHLFLQSIKYPFEANKWLSANSQIHNVSLFGDEEKTLKLKESLPALQVSLNCHLQEILWSGPWASWFGIDLKSLVTRS